MEGVNRLAKEQNEILQQFDVEFLTCGHCGVMVVVDWKKHSLNWKTNSENIDIITCWSCGYHSETCDFPDLQFGDFLTGHTPDWIHK